MNRISSLCIVSLLLASKSLNAQDKPNIVVFVADDSGKDYGCYGNPFVKTPNIDQLAADGIRFDKAFVSCPQSSPSRISMMTGMWAHSIKCEDLGQPIPKGVKILPSYLKEEGYYTGAMLKTHWGNEANKQFDFYYNGRNELYSEEYMTKENKFFSKYNSFLDNAKQNPFFLWVGFIDPHRPYKEKNTAKVHSPLNVKVHPTLIDASDTRQDIADYYDEIHRLDQNIGFMIDELKRRKLLDNTVIIFLSDNGLPFVRGKAFLYELGIESPLIVSWKGKIKPGTVHNNGLISFIDIAPTILDIAGAKPSDVMYGSSFLPILFDSNKRGRSEIFAERNFHDTEEYLRCIRTEKYKLIFNAYPYKQAGISADMLKSDSWWDLKNAQKNGELSKLQSKIFEYPRCSIELYDLENDPNEINNIADTKNGVTIVNDLLKKIRNWQKETKDSDWWENEQIDAIDRGTGQNIFPYKKRKIRNLN